MSVRVVEDIVFGTMVGSDGYWEKQERVPFLGRDVSIHVLSGDSDGPNGPQRVSYLQFLEKRDHLKEALEQAIFAYYQEVFEDYQDIWDEVDEDAADKYAPTLTSSEEIWKLVKPATVHILTRAANAAEPSYSDVSIEWWTTWDTEHQLETRYRDWEISSVVLY